jgi:dethiobiotin synthetase
VIFFPFKADIRLPGIPVMTIVVSLLCLLVYWQQARLDSALYDYANSYCESQTSRKDALVLKKLAGSDSSYDASSVCLKTYLQSCLPRLNIESASEKSTKKR